MIYLFAVRTEMAARLHEQRAFSSDSWASLSTVDDIMNRKWRGSVWLSIACARKLRDFEGKRDCI